MNGWELQNEIINDQIMEVSFRKTVVLVRKYILHVEDDKESENRENDNQPSQTNNQRSSPRHPFRLSEDQQ